LQAKTNGRFNHEHVKKDQFILSYFLKKYFKMKWPLKGHLSNM